MKYVKDCTNEDIGKELEQVCILADLDVPTEPAMVVEFIKKIFWRYDLNVISQSFELWLQGLVDVRRPSRLNAQFVASVVNKCVRDNMLKHVQVYQQQKAETNNVKPLTEEEQLHGYKICGDMWFKYEHNKCFDQPLMFLQVKYEYIYRNVDKMDFNETQRYDMIVELKEAYIESKKRQQLADAQRGIAVKINAALIDDLPNLNWNRIACVALHYRNVWKKNNENN